MKVIFVRFEKTIFCSKFLAFIPSRPSPYILALDLELESKIK